MSRAAAALLALVLAAAPRLAAACAVCSSGRDDETQLAFLIGTIFLSLTPLFLIGGVAYALWRRAKRLAADEAAGVIRLPERRAPRPAGPPGEPAAAPRPAAGALRR